MTSSAMVPLTVLAVFLLAASPVQLADARPMHGIAMHGAPKYPSDFKHLDYVNPDAPKGGTLRLARVGTFDSLNPNTIKGQAAAGLNFVNETLMARVWDEPFTLYGLIAETVETPEDRSWVEFHLRPEARFSDGTPITVDDVIFSWETIRTKGRPNSRTTFNKVARVDRVGERGIRFVFADASDRELPLLIAGFLPILSKAYWEGRDFTETTLEPVVGSGPYVVENVEQGRSIVYRRNPDYWGRDLPVNVGHHNFDEIRFAYYRDAGVAFEAFKAGDYDYRFEFSPSRWATQYDFPAVADGRVTLDVIDHGIASGLRAFAFNLRRPLFQDRRVREA
ncbi:MAG: extracellular solute-binding protein, partial [Alphaproteobacteria bacterium]